MSKRSKLLWNNRVFKRNVALYAVTESEARELFEQFKRSNSPMVMFAKQVHHKSHWLYKLFKKFFPEEYYNFIEARDVKVNRLYKMGRRFEYRIRDFLKGKGYFVLRSPRSGGPADLVAFKKGEVLMIQCKTGGLMLKKKKQELVSLAESVGAIAILAYKQKKKLGEKFQRGKELVFVNLGTKKRIYFVEDTSIQGLK